jgi:ectoine hydroxylase-related dioxygenase (phytanoyl-CoA dioxygenase family)
MLPFGPPPRSSLDVRPTADDVAFFVENGFLVVEKITTDEELTWLTQIFEAVFQEQDAVFHPGQHPDDEGPTLLSQSLFPELRFPELLDTTYVRNARHFAAALLGLDEADLTAWGHMIRKPPVTSLAAPWHQDEAYWEPELAYNAIGTWLPLHEVSVERGAMQFIPGSHRGELLEHRPESGDPRINLLVASPVDESAAVACPLPAGGATFHHPRTLHYTAPNTTDEARLAFPVEFQLHPVLRAEPSERQWVTAHREATGGSAPTSYIADGKVVAIRPLPERSMSERSPAGGR